MLALFDCVKRILEQYDALFQYFKQAKEVGIEAVSDLFTKMSSQYTKLYLEMLEFLLPMVARRNKEFQCEKPEIHTSYRKMNAM